MNKYVLSFFLLLTGLTVFGQKKSIVKLISSQSSTGIKLNGKDLVKVYQGTFQQDYSTLTSDSAYFYPDENAFDAFHNVVINQGDTLHIYADKLNYNGNTKIAILTDNVRMVDKDATLTTNHLVYNTATRIGTYTDGGKLVNKDNTLVSKNGYYFAFSRDSYFRYNVSLTTPDALVITDTMRYNTGTKISYFYGPTHIYSTKGEKDRDTLYTENGDYNTVTEQAAFGKKNHYNSGTKSLKGDSLFYDKLKGYGRAVKHVTFDDREQKVTIKGDLGTYFKAEERTVVTQDPYIIMVTEQKDSTNTDSAARADSIRNKATSAKKNVMSLANVIKNTIPGKIDSLDQKKNVLGVKTDSLLKKLPAAAALIKNGQLLKTDLAKVNARALQVKTDSLLKKLSPIIAQIKNNFPPKTDSTTINVKVLQHKADSLIRKLPPTTAAKKQGKTTKNKNSAKADNKNNTAVKLKAVKDTSKIKTDSIYMSADTIETRILTYKDLKIYFEKQRLAHIRDTASKPKKIKLKEKESKFLSATRADITINDTTIYHRDFFGKAKPPNVKKKAVKPPSKKQLALDSLRKKEVADSIIMAKLAEPNDTARIRIIIAHHHAKLFKSDLQGKADSMFYSNSDSTLRCYVNPIIWTQGSQLTGDTVYLQMKHKKLDNMTMFPNAFIVNIEKNDSVHFNQVGGKRMRGYFKDDKLHHMFIEGNAESIYFNRDSGKTTVNGMQRSLSTRITVYFKDNKATKLGFLTKPENKYTPLAKIKEDDKILKGFIWKPKERPVSKESIIPSYNNRKTKSAKLASNQSKTGGAAYKKNAKGVLVKDNSLPLQAGTTPGLKDSTLNADTAKINVVKPKEPFKVIIVN